MRVWLDRLQKYGSTIINSFSDTVCTSFGANALSKKSFSL